MKVMILARETDNHAAPILWGLQQAGYEAQCWAGLGWQPAQQAAVTLGNEVRVSLGSHQLDGGDVIWMRRLQPALLHPGVCEEDRKFAEEEYRWFHYSLMYLLERLPVTCINNYSASRLINNKSVQLMLAANCGLKVPQTCMTNAGPAVWEFLAPSGEPSICKAFFPHVWRKESGAMAVTETFPVDTAMLPSDEVLSYSPGIYQHRVRKQFDVRMVLMGTSIYSFAVRNPKGALDWRQDACQGLVQVESIATPADVAAGVLKFAQESGIVFGSFDFAVDQAGCWWFLEVNEQGQFLWLEEFCPAANLMRRFQAFVTSAGRTDETFEQRAASFPALEDYLRVVPKQQVRRQDKPTGQYVSTEA
jgi:glutathione synthase/RimK-type ligase-like ATP-grasp enzyme